MRKWFRDQHFRALVKNSSYLGASRSVAAVCSLATLAFAGRGLGLEQFGLLILIASYAQAASGLSKFQSWQLIVRYGGRVLHGEGLDEFRVSTGFALGLDLASGLAGMVVAIALLPLLGPMFGIDPAYVGQAMLFCLLLPTMAAATPNGVIRVVDRFDLLSWSTVANPISRAILTFIAWQLEWGFSAYLIIWFVTDLAGDLLIWVLAARELRRRDLLHGIRPTLNPVGLPGAWRFAVMVNLTTSLNTAWGPVGRLIVGGILGPASAAIYRVAATLADSAQKPADLLTRAYYPEIARMDLTTKHPWRLMKRVIIASMMFGGLAVAFMLVFGRLLITAVFGAEFADAYPVLLIMLGVPVLTIVSVPLPSTLYALDRADAPLKARIIATTVYFLLVVPLAQAWGVQGAALAFLLANVAMIATLAIYVRKEYRRVRGR